MNNQDKKAFEEWQESKPWIGDWKKAWCKEAWQAALEYERFHHKYCVVGSLDKLCEKLEAENKKLREALEFYADEKNMVSLTGLPFGRRAREALKEEE
jgi:hypothetical protein